MPGHVSITSNPKWRKYASLEARPLHISCFELIFGESGKRDRVEPWPCELFCRLRIGIDSNGAPILCDHDYNFRAASILGNHLRDHHGLDVLRHRSPTNATRLQAIDFFAATIAKHDRASGGMVFRSNHHSRPKGKWNAALVLQCTKQERQRTVSRRSPSIVRARSSSPDDDSSDGESMSSASAVDVDGTETDARAAIRTTLGSQQAGSAVSSTMVDADKDMPLSTRQRDTYTALERAFIDRKDIFKLVPTLGKVGTLRVETPDGTKLTFDYPESQ